MKVSIFAICFVILPALIFAQKNVGIGLGSPTSRLHIHQSNPLDDNLSAIQFTSLLTGNSLSDGLRLALIANNANFMNRENGMMTFGTSNLSVLNILSDGRIGINTTNTIGASDLTLNSWNSTGFGGMYLNIDDADGGKPFYGYSIGGTAKAWTYFNASDNKWIVYNGGEHLFLTNTGNMGLGVSAPVQKLDIGGRIKIGTDITADTEGAIQYKEGDFSGFTSEGKWKSLTDPDPIESMSYDDEIDFEFCSSPDEYWLSSIVNGDFFNSTCGVIYDSGGPTGNYGANENVTLYIDGPPATMIKIIIDELIIEDGNDELGIGTQYGDYLKFNNSILTPDTFLMETGRLFFNFNSDFSIQKPGFKVRFEFMTEAVPQKKQYSGYYYDFDKKALAAGFNAKNNWSDSLGFEAIAFGTDARAVGFSAIGLGYKATSSGTYSTALGNRAIAIASDGLAVGGNSSANHNYSSAFGWYAATNAENSIVIGRSGIASVGGYQNWSNLSDGRFKTNVQENIPGLAFINALRPVSYNLDLRKLNTFSGIENEREVDGLDSKAEKEIRTGFIAQEVLRSSEALDYDFSGIYKPQHDKDHFSLRYAEFVVPLVKAVQELSEENEKLKAELEKFETLERRIEKLEGALK